VNRCWTLVIPGKLFTLNGERTMHYHKRAKLVKAWREAAFDAATEAEVPSLGAIEVVFIPLRKDRRHMADTGGHFPVAKACIDGLVDAGVLPDDGPNFVRALEFRAPQVDGGDDRALIVVNEIGER